MNKYRYKLLAKGPIKLSNKQTGIILGIIIGILFGAIDIVFAAGGFDLNVAAGGVMQPVVTAIDAHWGKGLLIVGATGAALAQGDLKTRMFGFGGGVAIGGLAMLFVKLGLGIAVAP